MAVKFENLKSSMVYINGGASSRLSLLQLFCGRKRLFDGCACRMAGSLKPPEVWPSENLKLNWDALKCTDQVSFALTSNFPWS